MEEVKEEVKETISYKLIGVANGMFYVLLGNGKEIIIKGNHTYDAKKFTSRAERRQMKKNLNKLDQRNKVVVNNKFINLTN